MESHNDINIHFRAPPLKKGTSTYTYHSDLSFILSTLSQIAQSPQKQTSQNQTQIKMPHSKTPGGSGISDKEAKKQAQGTYPLLVFHDKYRKN